MFLFGINICIANFILVETVSSVSSASGASLAFVVGILSSVHACAETTLGEKQEIEKIITEAEQVYASRLSVVIETIRTSVAASNRRMWTFRRK